MAAKQRFTLKSMIGHTITAVKTKGIKGYDDRPFLLLTLSDGRTVCIEAEYDGYTGCSKEEYPRHLSIDVIK
jgi:hypothetical protein